MEFRYIRSPFLINISRTEISYVFCSVFLGIYSLLQEFVIYSSVEIALIGLVFGSGRNSVQIKLGHKPFNGFVVYCPAFVLQLQGNSPIAITFMVIGIDVGYGIHKIRILGIRIDSVLPIVVIRSWKMRQ